MNRSIAIDGPSGAGKSTIAKGTAKILGGDYLDTGAMYRAVGLYMLKNNIDLNDPAAIEAALPNADVNVRFDYSDVQHTFVNGVDVSKLLRTNDVSMAASAVGAVGAVRKALVKKQQELANEMFLICDGRDIGSVVMPDAALKIYLTADAEERARRRFNEMEDKSMGFEAVLNDINQRDYNDTHREVSPLVRTEDAVVIDSTHMSIEEVVAEVTRLYRERIPE